MIGKGSKALRILRKLPNPGANLALAEIIMSACTDFKLKSGVIKDTQSKGAFSTIISLSVL